MLSSWPASSCVINWIELRLIVLGLVELVLRRSVAHLVIYFTGIFVTLHFEVHWLHHQIFLSGFYPNHLGSVGEGFVDSADIASVHLEWLVETLLQIVGLFLDSEQQLIEGRDGGVEKAFCLRDLLVFSKCRIPWLVLVCDFGYSLELLDSANGHDHGVFHSFVISLRFLVLEHRFLEFSLGLGQEIRCLVSGQEVPRLWEKAHQVWYFFLHLLVATLVLLELLLDVLHEKLKVY